nr:uncharacterized protein LOC127314999 [Lolium perenne]
MPRAAVGIALTLGIASRVMTRPVELVEPDPLNISTHNSPRAPPELLSRCCSPRRHPLRLAATLLSRAALPSRRPPRLAATLLVAPPSSPPAASPPSAPPPLRFSPAALLPCRCSPTPSRCSPPPPRARPAVPWPASSSHPGLPSPCQALFPAYGHVVTALS